MVLDRFSSDDGGAKGQLDLDYDDQQLYDIARQRGKKLDEVLDMHTIDTVAELDEDDATGFDEEAFFTADEGGSTIVTKYDFEKQLDDYRKVHFQEIERYWVNKPYAFVSIFKSRKENEIKYYVTEPYLNEIEENLKDYIIEKLKDRINYDVDIDVEDSQELKEKVIEAEVIRLLDEYSLYSGDLDKLEKHLGLNEDEDEDEETEEEEAESEEKSGFLSKLPFVGGDDEDEVPELEVTARPAEAVVEAGVKKLTRYQVDKILYYVKRDSVGFQKIDPITHDIAVEDISCDGYNSPVFVYHGDYEQIISNIEHGKDSLDKFVVKLAQRSGKGISKRNPQVDVTLPDGSRGQLTLGAEVSDHGTNYTIRQFTEVPHTPIDLITWRTFSLEQMAFLWLCIQNHKSLIFAGGTASGKTTSLNAVSLFIPSSAKLVSIEDTREVELPQRNWIASVTRPSFTGDEKGDVDEFALLEAALRQRPEYIVMGEIRGEEGRTLFQVMSTGHTTYTTFHADSVGEVLKRFTTDPINVSKTMFTALDLVSIQSSTRVDGHKVRRNISLTEVNHYDAENDEINVQDVYQWQPETDSFIRPGESQLISDIKFDRGWSEGELNQQLQERQIILAYLIKKELKKYSQVAATFQAYMNDRQTVLTLIAEDRLEKSLENLREMESVLIDIDEEDEERTPRPSPDSEMSQLCDKILEEGKELLDDYRGRPVSLESALPSAEEVVEEDIEVEPDDLPDDPADLGLDDDQDKEEMTFGFDQSESDEEDEDEDDDPFGDLFDDEEDETIDVVDEEAEQEEEGVVTSEEIGEGEDRKPELFQNLIDKEEIIENEPDPDIEVVQS